MRRLNLRVNGRAMKLTLAAHTTLAELIRNHLGLTGTKIACDQAACGACTVLVNGDAVFSCHTLAMQADGADVETIEALAVTGTPHPLQESFIAHDALQCGFCTPGLIMTLKGAIANGVPADRAAMAHAISGNICRCGAYEHILDAAIDVASR
jgi:xanthine dehydrogenase YagT iron-sulfur-binding subunit